MGAFSPLIVSLLQEEGGHDCLILPDYDISSVTLFLNLIYTGRFYIAYSISSTIVPYFSSIIPANITAEITSLIYSLKSSHQVSFNPITNAFTDPLVPSTNVFVSANEDLPQSFFSNTSITDPCNTVCYQLITMKSQIRIIKDADQELMDISDGSGFICIECGKAFEVTANIFYSKLIL